jgi:plastocyanin
MKTSAIVAIVVALLVIVGAWYAYATYYSSPAAPSADTTVDTSPGGADSMPTSDTTDTSGLSADVNAGVTAATSATVTYTSSGGFSPKSLTVKKGSTVTFVKKDGGAMWLASDPHPAHSGYDGTSRTTHCAPGYTGAKPFDECSAGSSFSFTFDKVGTWGYHDHLLDENQGSITVVE